MTRGTWKAVLAGLLMAGAVAAGAALPPLRLYDESVALTQRFRLNFIGSPVACTDTSSTSTTTCAVTATPPVPTSSSLRTSWAIVHGPTSFSYQSLNWPTYINGSWSASNTCPQGAASTTTGTSPNVRAGLRCETNTTASTVAALVTTVAVFKASHGLKACFYAALTSTANPTRAWISMSSGVLSTSMSGSNTPSLSYLGFRYAPGVSTNWYACQDDGSGSPNCVDMTAAADTSGHVFCIDCSQSTTCAFTIDGSYSTNPGATKLPSVALANNIAVTNTASGGVRSGFDHFFTSFEATPP